MSRKTLRNLMWAWAGAKAGGGLWLLFWLTSRLMYSDAQVKGEGESRIKMLVTVNVGVRARHSVP
jgi:hypothetical protein